MNVVYSAEKKIVNSHTKKENCEEISICIYNLFQVHSFCRISLEHETALRNARYHSSSYTSVIIHIALNHYSTITKVQNEIGHFRITFKCNDFTMFVLYSFKELILSDL